MYQAYIKPDRQTYTRQKDLPDIKTQPQSHVIYDEKTTPKTPRLFNRFRGQTHYVRRYIRNLDVFTNTKYNVASTKGVVEGCRVNVKGVLEVAMCGSASQVTVYGTLIVGPGGHVDDVVLKGHGRLVVEPGGNAKRVYKDGTDCSISCSDQGHVTEARYNRVSGFPINI